MLKHSTHFSTALHALSHRAVNDVTAGVAEQILHCKGEVLATDLAMAEWLKLCAMDVGALQILPGTGWCPLERAEGSRPAYSMAGSTDSGPSVASRHLPVPGRI